MKKLHVSTVLLFVLLISYSSFGRNFELPARKLNFNKTLRGDGGDKNVISGGFFVLIGIGTPSFKYNDLAYTASSRIGMGTQFSVEIGNQFMIYKQEGKFGIGISSSWFTFGYSSVVRSYTFPYDNYYSNGSTYTSYYTANSKFFNYDFRFLKFGPMGTVAVGPLAIDASFDIIPLTLFVGGTSTPTTINTYNSYYTGSTSHTMVYTQYGIFSNFDVCVKARYKIFTAGVDVLFGHNNYADSDVSGTYHTSTFTPKVVFGFRF